MAQVNIYIGCWAILKIWLLCRRQMGTNLLWKSGPSCGYWKLNKLALDNVPINVAQAISTLLIRHRASWKSCYSDARTFLTVPSTGGTEAAVIVRYCLGCQFYVMILSWKRNLRQDLFGTCNRLREHELNEPPKRELVLHPHSHPMPFLSARFSSAFN